MRGDESIETNELYDWYKMESIIIGVREKKMGGFSIKIHENNLELNLKSIKTLITKIVDYYKYQFMTFDSRNISDKYRKNIDQILREIGFGKYQSHNYAYQERPKVGDKVLIAIKPYNGVYEKGKIARILTSAQYHPRGFKVMLNDKAGTIGRISTFRKEVHRKEI